MDRQPQTDWARFVAKTRRRPLMWRPGVFPNRDGTLFRPQLADRLVPFVVGTGLGVPLLWIALSPNADMRPVLLVVGLFCLWIACSDLFRTRRLFVHTDSDDIVVHCGFFLLPTQLVFSRQDVVAEYRLGADTNLAKSLHGFKFILFRHRETNEVAHFGFTLVSDDAMKVFDALSDLVGEGHNYSQAVVTLDDGSTVMVDRLATWAAGKWRSYENQLTEPDSKTIEITRRAFGENRTTADPAADIYPMWIESLHDAVRIQYSNHEEKTVSLYDCVAVQICKEEIAQRRTRYEVNLITDSSTTERVNLMSFDIAPDQPSDVVRDAATKIATLLELEIADHR